LDNKVITAIVVKSNDYKESDKMLRLFTANGQIINAVLKGVKKPNAKLKFCGQIFAFCEFTLAEKNGFYTIANATQIENLFSITHDAISYSSGSLMLELSNNIATSMQGSAFFVELLKCFKAILYSNKCPLCTATYLIYNALEMAGYCRLPSWLVDTTHDTLPQRQASETAFKALQHAMAKLERHLDVKLASKAMLINYN